MPLIKVCGITNLKDAVNAIDAGADLLGFVCDENSQRYVSPDDFLSIHTALPRGPRRVAVFHRQYSPEWASQSESLVTRFDCIQYETDAVWSDIIGENWDMHRKIRSFPLTNSADLLTIASYNGLTQNYLVNVHVHQPPSNSSADEYGWSLARQVHQFGKRVYLAGGLTPSNVGSAVIAVHPYGLDVTVGVEASPGHKDRAKMRDFIQAARAVERLTI